MKEPDEKCPILDLYFSTIKFRFETLFCISFVLMTKKKVQVGKDQEKAQSEKDSHSKNQGEKKPN